MRGAIVIISILYTSLTFGQSIDSLNISNDMMLSRQEAELLNSLLEKSRGTFDFHGKKVAFLITSMKSRVLTKSDYFKEIAPWLDKGDTPQIWMVELTEEERNRTGGYDAFVLSWAKRYTVEGKEKLIQQLAAEIKEAYVFSSFNQGGTTVRLNHYYSELKESNAIKHKLSDGQLDEFKALLKDVKWRKHWQQKIGGIERGIELCNAKGCYCVLLTPTRLIDISGRYECKISETQYASLKRILNLQ